MSGGGNQRARRTAGRTTHARGLPPAQQNDRWLTPPAIVAALGSFDLDPCGAPGHVLAGTTYLLENGDDGLNLLTHPWFGRVWLNPPYGRTMRTWVERLADHGTGTALIPVATDTDVWQSLVFREASAVLFYRRRLNFLRRDGAADGMGSMQASALVAYGDDDAAALHASGLPGTVLELREPCRRAAAG